MASTKPTKETGTPALKANPAASTEDAPESTAKKAGTTFTKSDGPIVIVLVNALWGRPEITAEEIEPPAEDGVRVVATFKHPTRGDVRRRLLIPAENIRAIFQDVIEADDVEEETPDETVSE